MASGWTGPGVIPPPPGVTPNFIDPPGQLGSNIALHAVCLTLVTIAVGMRLYTRLFVTRSGLGLDDAFCVLSYCLTITFSGMMLKCYTLGIGRHMWDVQFKSFSSSIRLFTFAQYIYILLALFIKLTFLIFYYRLFSLPSTRYRYILHGVIAFVVALNVGLFFATLFNCNPRERNWDPTVKGKCFPPSILPWFSGASSSLTDIIVLIIPIPILWGMQMAFNKKVRAMAVFGLGAFVCIASIIRMAMTQVLYSNPDRTRNLSTIAVWATLEVNLGIICSCLMFLPAFLDRHLPESAKDSLSRLWDSTLTSIGLGSKKSSSSLAINPGPIAWPGDSSSSSSAKHHPFVEMRPSGSQSSMQMRSGPGGNMERISVSIPSSHSLKFGDEEAGGVNDAHTAR